MKKVMKAIVFGILAYSFGSIVFLNGAKADDIYTVVVKKQQEKQKNRFSLSDWLETRDRIRLMDLWLAFHTPTPFEFAVGGSYQFNQVTHANRFNAQDFYFLAYASIFGLEGRYESGVQNQWSGLFNLRVFGFHDQATHINLQVGLKTTTFSDSSVSRLVVGVNSTLYLARYFGATFGYQHYPVGRRLQGGAFIDFKLLRVYGEYFEATEETFNTQGMIAGARLYF
jgi:hypothetical protein